MGVALTCWDYMWRTTPLHRREIIGERVEEHLPPALPREVDHADLVEPADGHGPLFHRLYTVRIRAAQVDADELMDAIAENPNRVAPTMAHFQKVLGSTQRLRVGDEYVVRMPGPWDGPVRVVHRSPNRFRLATLQGHLEAGQIEFRVLGEQPGLVVEIESWARSASRISHLLYHCLHMSKEVQFHMWVSFLERSARLARGRRSGGVTVETVRVEAVAG